MFDCDYDALLESYIQIKVTTNGALPTQWPFDNIISISETDHQAIIALNQISMIQAQAALSTLDCRCEPMRLDLEAIYKLVMTNKHLAQSLTQQSA